MTQDDGSSEFLVLTADIVASYVASNTIAVADLPQLIQQVYGALASVSATAGAGRKPPAVSPRRSITPDYLVCLEDGRKLKMLKRHIMTHYGLTPEEYRERWGLPGDYPMVAPNYAKQRRALAKKIGLGTSQKVKRSSKRKSKR